MSPFPTRRRSRRDDAGAAMIMTIMVIALVATLATTVATLTINNLQSATRAQEAGVAANAADAGVSQAVAYLRANGVRGLCASPTTFDEAQAKFDSAFDLASQTCVTSPEGGQPLPGQGYSVLIVTQTPYVAGGVGEYVVYARGTGQVGAARLVSARIEMDGIDVPQGLFGRTVAASGNVTVENQSVFSTGCVFKRKLLDLEGMDAYGLPAAVHSSRAITESGDNKDCETEGLRESQTCVADYPFDQDAQGGPLNASSACVTSRSAYPSVSSATWSKYYPDGSRIADKETLLERFGIKDPALTRPEIEQLRRTAHQQGNLWHRVPGTSEEVRPLQKHAVLFFDLTSLSGNPEVDLRTIKGFAPEAGCPNKSLVIVVEGGSTKYPTGQLAASLFLTMGGDDYNTTGGAVIGSVFADHLDLGGNAIVAQEDQLCLANTPSPALAEFTVTSYREIDS